MTDLSTMYETVSPINATVHGDVSIKPVTGFEFAQKINSVPVLATEFAAAASDMALVFSGDDEELLPVALLGVTENKNLYGNKIVDKTTKLNNLKYFLLFSCI